MGDNANLHTAFVELNNEINKQSDTDYHSVNLIRSKANMLVLKAKREEKMAKLNNGSVEDDMAVSNLYLEAVFAKLRLLDKI